MIAQAQIRNTAKQRHSLFWPYVISFLGHMLLFTSVLWGFDWQPKQTFIPSVIDVQMVELPESVSAPVEKTSAVKLKTPEKIKKKEVKTSEPKVDKPSKDAVSIAPRKKKTKTALKYKTFKPKKMIQKALNHLEKEVETATPKPLEDTIKRLREKVAKEGKSRSGSSNPDAKTTKGKKGVFAANSKQEIEAIDIYRQEIAYEVNANWAFSEQLAGGTAQLKASVVFKVMPDGHIEDIFFTDRSGNQYLDDSAIKAIKKSDPVSPHPQGLARPYVQMGLHFTPSGVY